MGKYKRYERYKDSGVEWIGEVPVGWEIKKLKYIGEAIIGLTYSPSDITDEVGTLVLRSSNIQDTKIVFNDNVYVGLEIPNRLRTKEGDIIICSRSGSRELIGKNAYIEKENAGLSFGAFMTIFRSKYNRYLRYVFNSTMFKNQSASFLTSTINQITVNNLYSFLVPIPPLKEQTQIANFLEQKTSEIDALVADKEKLIILLEEKRQAIITEAVTKGLDPNVKMKDSGVEWIGEVPEHWEIQPLFTLFEESKIKNIGNKEHNVLSLSYGKIVRRDVEANFGLLPESFETYQIVDKGNIVLRLTDLQNDKRSLRCGLVKEKGIITSAYVALKATCDIKEVYSYYLLYGYDLFKVFYGFGNGVRQSMGFVELKRMPILLPPIEEQIQIANFLEQKTSEIDALNNEIRLQIQKLKEYRQSLISEAVTGKIDLRDKAGRFDD